MNTEIYINQIYTNLFATFAPGKKDHRWNRNLDADLNILKNVNNVNVIVCLLPLDELEILKISDIKEKCSNINIEFYHYPIVDDTVPELIDEFNEFINLINELMKTKKVCVFCRGGLGRTGLVCASILLKNKFTPTHAISTVRSRRRTALGRKHQQQFIYKYHNYLRKLRITNT
ncbi:protein-tyrosine phosphatase [Fadolivirus algeromassiliense]|jgi:ADP-ribosyl-[dinitrogen reductase] hydrolase|uniref:Protein-tyrosine phosphatase n=1 Tax=Fadolivirus FV1/VV64 TaxID=3070911 RepID=A0A7D3QW46_9VIRU|nr:protein-tyrosine phosphatase [Fadolivirus algeromassiliense]QKF94219.1 protein-tyrosine phosphatase [Fadolivirus FV1/VV64]